MTLDDYLNRITSEHRDKPKFVATATACLQPLLATAQTAVGLPQDFDLDQAAGVQLDVVGQWVGVSRLVDAALVGVYFTWDDPDNGWQAGSWKGPFDPDSGLVSLPDDSFRTLIRAKIAANSWDGTIPGAYAIWETLFPETILLIQDKQDMTMIIALAGQPLSLVDQALLVNGYLPLKPEGVQISSYELVPDQGKIFAWDVAENDALAGWDVGQWTTTLNPTT